MSGRRGGGSAVAEAVGVEDVAFGVLTCERHLPTRLLAQRRTWLWRVRGRALALSDRAGGDVVEDGLEIVGEQPPMRPHELLSPGSGARRALPLVERLHGRFPQAKWYFFVDDDTFVYLPTLLRVLSERDYRGSHYVGWSYPAGPQLHGFLPGEWRPEIGIGGAGFAISAPLMKRLASAAPRCRRDYTWDWPGDLRIARCIADLGYDVEDDRHLNAEGPPPWALQVPPATFHHLLPETMDRLFAGQVVRSDDGRKFADFSDFAFVGMTLRSEAGLAYSLRFGVEVNVSSAAAGSSSTPLERASELVSAGAEAAAGRARGFVQEFRGGPCTADSQRRLRITVSLTCGECSADRGRLPPRTAAPRPPAVPEGRGATAGREGSLVGCAAGPVDRCSHRMLLSIRPCPEWEPLTL